MTTAQAVEQAGGPAPGIGEVDFDRVSKYIEAALAYGHEQLTLDEVRDFVRTGKYQLWAGVSSVIVTELVDYPRERVLHFTLAGGNQPELRAMLDPILAWGKSKGATRATLLGRLGWQRSFLPQVGWKTTRVVMERSL